jgi:hypothetical protein
MAALQVPRGHAQAAVHGTENADTVNAFSGMA